MSLYSIPAEQSVLGEIISNPYRLDDAIGQISHTSFSRSDHAEIFKVLVRAKQDGIGIDPVTISSLAGDLIDIDYLCEIIECASGSMFDDHLKIISDFSFKRGLLKNCQELANHITNNESDSVDNLISITQSQASKVLDYAVGKEDTSQSYKGMMKSFLSKLKERALNDTGITGLATGFRDFDEITSGLMPSNLIIVAARPSMGKTASTMNIIENVCSNGGRAMVFSMEMPADDLLQRSVASIGKINLTNLQKGNLTPLEQASLSRTVEKLSNFDIVIDDQAALTIAQLRARAIREHRKKKLDVIMVDYLQLMKGEGAEQNQTIIIGKISNGLKALAKELQIPVIALSQLNRSLEQRPNKRPINSDLRDSGNIEQDADLIVFVYRDEVYNPDSPDKGIAELIIGKNRNGSLGTVRLQYIGYYTRFENIAPIDNAPIESFRQPLELQNNANFIETADEVL